MGLVLLLVIVLTWIIGLKIYGQSSVISGGLLGFTAYSMPAVVQRVYPFEENLGVHTTLIRASDASTAVMLIAWLSFCVTIALRRRPPATLRISDSSYPNRSKANLQPFVTAALLLCVAGFFVLAVTEGPLFFLEDRREQADTHLRLLWRWLNAVGLIAAVLTRNWRACAVFFAGLVIYFLAGDRTVIVITLVCLAIITTHGRSFLRLMLRPSALTGIMLFIAIAIFGKPIYFAVKSGSFDAIWYAASETSLVRYAISFEPFVTYNILEIAIRHEFQTSIVGLLENILAQALIVPSMFGIDSNAFNTNFTDRFAFMLNYGVAGNYWAQGWAVGGSIGVVVFAVIYGVALRTCDYHLRRPAETKRVFFAVVGTLIAIYVHRNSLDNMLSFVRQILVVFIATSLVALALRPALGTRSRSVSTSQHLHREFPCVVSTAASSVDRPTAEI